MRLTLVAFLCLGCLPCLGCSPGLTDGAYRCNDGGSCPPDWTCGFDSICYENGIPQFDRCENGDMCASGVCVKGPGAAPEDRDGYCSLECTSIDDCEFQSMDTTCVSGECLVDCRGESCPGDTGCFIIQDPMIMPPAVPSCFEVEDPALLGRDGCDDPMACPVPSFCIQADAAVGTTLGVCTTRCLMDMHCPMGNRCVEVLSGEKSCLRQCMGDMDCQEGLTCASVEAPEITGMMRLCVPPEWASPQEWPLPGEITMPMM